MTFLELLSPDRIVCGATVTSKKRALQHLAELLSETQPDLLERTAFDRLCSREKLGSTGLGNGIALPHGRVPGLDTPRAALLTLSEPIDFDAIDGENVDLLVGLLVPEDANETHLQILAELATNLSDKRLCAAIRAAKSPRDILELLDSPPKSDCAAATG